MNAMVNILKYLFFFMMRLPKPLYLKWVKLFNWAGTKCLFWQIRQTLNKPFNYKEKSLEEIVASLKKAK